MFLSPNTTHMLSHQPHHHPSAFTIRIQHHLHPHPPQYFYLVSSFFFTFIRICSPTHPHVNTSSRPRICTPTHLHAHASARQRIFTPMHPHANASARQRIHPHTSTRPTHRPQGKSFFSFFLDTYPRPPSSAVTTICVSTQRVPIPVPLSLSVF